MTYIEEIDIRMLPSVRGKTLKETMEGLNPKAPVSISGGFGYSKEDAIVIEKPNQELPFDGVALEHFVAKARLLMEAGVIRYNGEKFRVFDIKRGNQFLVKGESSHVYDHLEYTVVLAYESKLEDLKKILQKHRAEGTGRRKRKKTSTLWLLKQTFGLRHQASFPSP